MIPVESRWEGYSLTGFVSKPTDHRPSRSMQTFFVNGRPVKSRLLIAALEEAYRNQIMVGKFPACVLHLNLPANAVDVNVHPAKTEVKFLNEKAVFDCVHYGTLGALNKTPDRPDMQFRSAPAAPSKPVSATASAPKKQEAFKTMTVQEYKSFTAAMNNAPKPEPVAAMRTVAAIEQTQLPLHSPVVNNQTAPIIKSEAIPAPAAVHLPTIEQPKPAAVEIAEEPEQAVMDMPAIAPWRLVGELYRSYIIVEQGEEAFLIDKHAAHERILFEKLKANQEVISSQTLLSPVPCRLRADAAAELLSNKSLLEELGFEVDEFGTGTVLVRQVPMDIDESQIQDTLETIATDLMNGRRESRQTVRDEAVPGPEYPGGWWQPVR